MINSYEVTQHSVHPIDGIRPYKRSGFFPDAPIAEPAVALAAIAMKTRRIRIGALLTPLARQRPWAGAREAVSKVSS